MKKLMGIMSAVLLASCANAQKVDVSKVPDVVKKSFTKNFTGVSSAKWDKEGKDYEASFKKDGHDMSALFMTDGMLMETETDIAVTELPAVVIEYVKTHYKGKAIKEAAIIIKANGVKNYEAEVDEMDVLFDASGKFLKEVKEDEEKD